MRQCKTCGKKFNPDDQYAGRGPRRTVFCSVECWKRNKSHESWIKETSKISGDWTAFFKLLIRKKKSAYKESFTLTIEDLLEVLQSQNGKCALTGRDLQCRLVPGIPSPENASIDRIVAGGPYSKGNVQLICRDVNNFRNDTPLKNFIHICTLVAQTAAKKPA